MVMKITHNVAVNFHPILIPLNQLFGAILDFEFWPPASPSIRLYEPEAGGAIGAYPPACKPTGWKRPRRDCGLRPVGPLGPTPWRDLLYRFALSLIRKDRIP